MTMAARKDLRREIRRRAIVDAAAAVFAEHGIQSATLDQIGEKVGLSKASLYYYVKSKEQLIADVLAGVLEDIDARAAQLTDPDSNALDQLKMRARAHVETAFQTEAGRLIVANIDALVDTKTTAAQLRRHEQPARSLLQRARDEGLAADIDIVCAVKLLYGALNNIPRWHRPEDGPLDAVIESTWKIFTGGIAANSSNAVTGD